MAVSVRGPGVQVQIFKRIARRAGLSQRYKDADRVIDLRDFLGDGCSVTTRKSLPGDPCGSFEITLLDQLDTRKRSGSMDSLYARIEPMDYVEIRMAAAPHIYGGRLPIVMRGFVTSVRRTEGIGDDQKPQRKLVISGHDFGKLLKSVQVFTGPRFGTGADLLSSFRLFVKYGISPNLMPANAFLALCAANILNPWLQRMRSGVGAADVIPLVELDARIPEGMVAPYGKQQYEGSLWDFMSGWIDFPWNELFIEDRDSGPVIVGRATPFFDLAGKPIQGGYGSRPDIATTINADLATDIMVGRSDADVANYFWVEPPATEMHTRELLITAAASSGELFFDGPNSALDLYGLRKMSAATQQIGGAVTNRELSSDQEADRRTVSAKQTPWIERRRETLKRMNGDNVLYEDGSMTVPGDEKLKFGRYARVRRGDFSWTCYVTSVVHQFVIFGAFKSRIEFVRGTGFYERTAREDSAYLHEIPRGPYAR